MFTYPNPHLLAAILRTAEACEVHTTEDILDIRGMKLWPGGKPVNAHLVELLSGCHLQKPIELCILCSDPVEKSGTIQTIESIIEVNDAFRRLVSPQLDVVIKAIRAATPNPTELLLISVLRYGARERHSHAAAVTAIALALAAKSGTSEESLQRLVHAGMLHDVGELYLDPLLFEGTLSSTSERMIMEHARLGARAALELARTGPDIAHAIGESHERLNGSGYPDGLVEDEITLLARPLLVAEAISELILHAPHGLVRASIATRLVPSEFPQEYVNTIHAQSRHTEFPELLSTMERRAASDRLVWARDVSQRMAHKLDSVHSLRLNAEDHAVLDRVGSVLHAVQKCIFATGAVEAFLDDFPTEDAHSEFESQAIAGEVWYRLRKLSLQLSGALETARTSEMRVQIEQLIAGLETVPPA